MAVDTVSVGTDLGQQSDRIIKWCDDFRHRFPLTEVSHVDTIKNTVKSVGQFGETLDYNKDHPYNGVRTAFKITIIWLSGLKDEENVSDKQITRFIPVLKFIAWWFNILDQLSQDPIDIKLFYKVLDEFDKNMFKTIHARGFYAKTMPEAKLNLTYKLTFVNTRKGFWKKTRAIFVGQKKAIKKMSNKMARFNDVESTVENLRSFSKVGLPLGITRLFSKSKVQIKKVSVSIDSEFDITLDVEVPAKLSAVEMKKKLCCFKLYRLPNPGSETLKRTLLIYIPGGGFVAPRHPTVEYMFAREWCQRNPGLTVLTTSHRLAPEDPFPAAILDILDLYLWVTSKSDAVKEHLGFIPDHVLVSGDSSGANISLVLAILLNEIKAIKPEMPIKMPSAIITSIPKVSLDHTNYASIGLASLDVILNINCLNSLARAYIPLKYKDANDKWQLCCDWNEKPIDWYNREDWSDLPRTPFLSPVYYEKMDDLACIPLYIECLEYDILLDEAVQIAKVWKGPVHFLCLKDAIHGPASGEQILAGMSGVITKALDGLTPVKTE